VRPPMVFLSLRMESIGKRERVKDVIRNLKKNGEN